ncbi:MAG: hypothetical protein MJ252_07845 [archaeon]|nr:hypothetical protein [archaeon]
MHWLYLFNQSKKIFLIFSVLNLRNKLILSRGTKNLKTKFKPKEILEDHQRFLNAKTLIFQNYLSDISSDLKDFFHLSKFSLFNLSFIKKEDEIGFKELQIREEIKPVIIPFIKLIYIVLDLNYEDGKEDNCIKILYDLSSQKYGKDSLKEIFIKDFLKKINEFKKEDVYKMQEKLSELLMKNEFLFSSCIYLPLSPFCSKLSNCLKYFYDLLNDYIEKNKMVQAIETKIGNFVDCSETLKKKKDSLALKLNKK